MRVRVRVRANLTRRVVYESMHNSERIEATAEYMRGAGYRYMKKLGWNHMFEKTQF